MTKLGDFMILDMCPVRLNLFFVLTGLNVAFESDVIFQKYLFNIYIGFQLMTDVGKWILNL